MSGLAAPTAQLLRLACLVTLVACEGPQGPAGSGEPGVNALAQTSDEAPGANCANGGLKLEVGIDTNGNGVLDVTEVTDTSYICNGDGTDSLVRTGPEAAGTNCPWGGTRIETGLDTDGDGVLDDNEVNAGATSYVCNFGPTGSTLSGSDVRTRECAPVHDSGSGAGTRTGTGTDVMTSRIGGLTGDARVTEIPSATFQRRNIRHGPEQKP